MFIKRNRKTFTDEELLEIENRVNKTKIDLPPSEPPTATNEREWQKTWDLFNAAGDEYRKECNEKDYNNKRTKR